MNKKLLMILIILGLTLVVAFLFSEPYLRVDRFGNVAIEWVDFVKIDGEMYHLEYDRSENDTVKVIIDPSEIGEFIGSVQFTLADNVHNDAYKIRDWDAGYLEAGTKIYAFTNQTDKISVVAEVSGLYYLYSILPH